MSVDLLTRTAMAWVALALAETLHGILRVRFLNRRLGDRRARQVSVFSGSLIILAISWFLVPWVGPVSPGQALTVGVGWVVLMLAYDLGLGRFAFRLPWSRLAADFDLRKGGFLGLGMLVLLLAPAIVGKVRGWW